MSCRVSGAYIHGHADERPSWDPVLGTRGGEGDGDSHYYKNSHGTVHTTHKTHVTNCVIVPSQDAGALPIAVAFYTFTRETDRAVTPSARLHVVQACSYRRSRLASHERAIDGAQRAARRVWAAATCVMRLAIDPCMRRVQGSVWRSSVQTRASKGAKLYSLVRLGERHGSLCPFPAHAK